CCALVATGRSEDAPPLASDAVFEDLARQAVSLAKRVRKADVEEVLDVMTALRAPQKTADAARQAAAKAYVGAKPAVPPFPDVAKALAKDAATLGAAIAAAADDAKPLIARQALRLDGTQKESHDALGDVERNGIWIPAWTAAALERRAKV